MTPEQKMQKVIEAAGECWHELVGNGLCKCGAPCNIGWNPSPTDLNAMFRLAENINHIKFSVIGGDPDCQLWSPKFGYVNGYGKTKKEALLDALYKAIS